MFSDLLNFQASPGSRRSKARKKTRYQAYQGPVPTHHLLAAQHLHKYLHFVAKRHFHWKLEIGIWKFPVYDIKQVSGVQTIFGARCTSHEDFPSTGNMFF